MEPAILEPKWDGPHIVILSTSTAVNIIGTVPWSHHSWLKLAAQDKWTSQEDSDQPNQLIVCWNWAAGNGNPALVIPEADQSMDGQNLRI